MTSAADGFVAGPAVSAVIRLSAVDSTQAVAFALAADGAPDGTVVVADYQRAGRGRAGRVWSAPAGTALLASVILRPRAVAADLPRYSFVAALATAEAIERCAPVSTSLKWPNDVLVHDKKLAGILLEARSGDADRAVVAVGIGVNLGQTSFPPELADRATSLALETGIAVGRDALLDALLPALGRWRERVEREGFGAVRAGWLARAETIGRPVSVDGIVGIAVDLASDGALVVDDGRVRHRVVAGEIGLPAAGRIDDDAAGR